MKIKWVGKGINEKGYYKGSAVIKCDKSYIRPLDVQTLLGNASKARKVLKWKPKYNISQLVKEMVVFEIKKLS